MRFAAIGMRFAAPGHASIRFLTFLLLCAVASSLRPSSRRRFVAGAAIAAPAAAAARDLQFKDLGDGLTVAQITEGRGDAVVRRDSVVLVELVGRLVGKQGWTFEDSREDGDPYRLQLGQGLVVEGLERALVGARVGEVRRTIVPSRLAYVDREKEPIPRSPAFRNRLYGTVLNDNRKTQETAGLGADVAGVVAFDVKVLNIRPPR